MLVQLMASWCRPPPVISRKLTYLHVEQMCFRWELQDKDLTHPRLLLLRSESMGRPELDKRLLRWCKPIKEDHTSVDLQAAPVRQRKGAVAAGLFRQEFARLLG